VGGSNRDGGKYLRGALVEEAAPSVGQAGPGPSHQVRIDPFGLEHAAEGGGVDVVETPLDVQEEGRYLSLSHLEGSDLVSEGGRRIRGREAHQRSALVLVQEATSTGHTGES